MKKNLLLLTLVATLGLFSFTDSKENEPIESKVQKLYIIESTYSYYDQCGQILFVTVQCSGSCDVNGNMLDAADAFANDHRNPVTGCYFL